MVDVTAGTTLLEKLAELSWLAQGDVNKFETLA
jgi:hypothetical protein